MIFDDFGDDFGAANRRQTELAKLQSNLSRIQIKLQSIEVVFSNGNMDTIFLTWHAHHLSNLACKLFFSQHTNNSLKTSSSTRKRWINFPPQNLPFDFYSVFLKCLSSKIGLKIWQKLNLCGQKNASFGRAAAAAQLSGNVAKHGCEYQTVAAILLSNHAIQSEQWP